MKKFFANCQKFLHNKKKAIFLIIAFLLLVCSVLLAFNTNKMKSASASGFSPTLTKVNGASLNKNDVEIVRFACVPYIPNGWSYSNIRASVYADGGLSSSGNCSTSVVGGVTCFTFDFYLLGCMDYSKLLVNYYCVFSCTFADSSFNQFIDLSCTSDTRSLIDMYKPFYDNNDYIGFGSGQSNIIISAMGFYYSIYDSGYDSGYETGYNEGNSSGVQAGYNLGYRNGVETSYNEGYEDGWTAYENDADNTSDLIFTIFNAPFNVLREVFNFEILGINISSLVFFLLSCCLIAFVIKRVK